jgi:hypothetical protein
MPGSVILEHAARVQDMGRVECILDPARQCGERCRLRLEDRDRATQGRRALDKRGMAGPAAVRPADRGADDFGPGIAGFGHGHPEQTAAPIEKPDRIERPRYLLPQFRAAGGRDRDAPDRAAG